jgi:Uma2 family endonuclease
MTPHERPRATLTHHFRRADIVRMALPLLRGPFTVDAFQRLAELGVLREDDRVELIAGQVVEMTPIGDSHASCVRRLNRVFARHLLEVAVIDVQNPVVLGAHDAPQPDLALLRPRADAYPRHPRATDMLLVIEVADTSLAYDRDIKIPLYARAGIPEAWLVDVSAGQIQVYREPAGGEYASVRSVSRGDGITPLHFPNVTLSADEILG